MDEMGDPQGSARLKAR